MNKYVLAIATLLVGYFWGCHRGWVNHIESVNNGTPPDMTIRQLFVRNFWINMEKHPIDS